MKISGIKMKLFNKFIYEVYCYLNLNLLIAEILHSASLCSE